MEGKRKGTPEGGEGVKRKDGGWRMGNGVGWGIGTVLCAPYVYIYRMVQILSLKMPPGRSARKKTNIIPSIFEYYRMVSSASIEYIEGRPHDTMEMKTNHNLLHEAGF